MRRQHKISDLVYRNIFPNPGPSDPPDFATHLQKNLVGEVRVETTRFYGSLDTVEARYPGLNYSHPPHRRRLSRFPHHARLFQAFDELELTETEIGMLCRWEGTLWARERYERDEGVKVVDTTGTEIGEWVNPRRSYTRRQGGNGASAANGAVSGKEIKVMTDIEVEIEDADRTTAGASSSSLQATMASVILRSRDAPTHRVHARRTPPPTTNARHGSQSTYPLSRDSRRFRASPLRTASPRRAGVDASDGNTRMASDPMLDASLTTLLGRLSGVSAPSTDAHPASAATSADRPSHPTSTSDHMSRPEPRSSETSSNLGAFDNSSNIPDSSAMSLDQPRPASVPANGRTVPSSSAESMSPVGVSWEELARVLPADVDRASVAQIWENLIKELSEAQGGSTGAQFDGRFDPDTLAAAARIALQLHREQSSGSPTEHRSPDGGLSRLSASEDTVALRSQLQHHQEQIGSMARAIQEYYRSRTGIEGNPAAAQSS